MVCMLDCSGVADVNDPVLTPSVVRARFIYTNLGASAPNITVPTALDVDGKFVDTNFPAVAKSIGPTLLKALPSNFRWKRPPEICAALDINLERVMFVRDDTRVTRQISNVPSMASSYSDQHDAAQEDELYGSLLEDMDNASMMETQSNLGDLGEHVLFEKPHPLVKHATVLYDDEGPDTEDEDDNTQDAKDAKEVSSGSSSLAPASDSPSKRPNFSGVESDEDEDEVDKKDAEQLAKLSMAHERSMLGSAVSRTNAEDETEASPIAQESRIVLGTYSTSAMKVALSVVVNHPVLPGAVLHEYDEQRGLVKCRFFVQGWWCWVITDDRLPTHDGQLLFSHTINQNEFGIALIEKCYAVLCGSYQQIYNVPFEDVLMDMSGTPIQTFDLQQVQVDIAKSPVKVRRKDSGDNTGSSQAALAKASKELRVDKFRQHSLQDGEVFEFGHRALWLAITEANKHGAVTVCGQYSHAVWSHALQGKGKGKALANGTPAPSQSRREPKPSLPASRRTSKESVRSLAFPFIDGVGTVSSNRGYILASDPTANGHITFGAPNFTLGTSPSAVKGSSHTTDQLGSKEGSNISAAEINVPCEKIGSVFNRLDICQAFPQQGCSSRRFQTAWAYGCNGGSPKYATFRDNPMYRVHAMGATTEKLDIWIGQLGGSENTEDSHEGKSSSRKHYVSAAIVVATFDRVKDVDADATMVSGHRRNIIALSEFKAVRNRSLSLEVAPTSEIMVVPCTEFPGQMRQFYVNFTWRGDSSNFGITECLPTMIHRTYMNSSSAWNDTSAGGPPTADTFKDNPCFLLRLDPDQEAKVQKAGAAVPISVCLRTIDYSSTSFRDGFVGSSETDDSNKKGGKKQIQLHRAKAPRSIAVAVLKQHPKEIAAGSKLSEALHVTSQGSTLAPQKLKDLPAPKRTLEWTTSLMLSKEMLPVYFVPYTKQVGQFGRFSLVVSSASAWLDLSDVTDWKPAPVGTEHKGKGRNKFSALAKSNSKLRRWSEPAVSSKAAEVAEGTGTASRYKEMLEKKQQAKNRRRMMLFGGDGGDSGDGGAIAETITPGAKNTGVKDTSRTQTSAPVLKLAHPNSTVDFALDAIPAPHSAKTRRSSRTSKEVATFITPHGMTPSNKVGLG